MLDWDQGHAKSTQLARRGNFALELDKGGLARVCADPGRPNRVPRRPCLTTYGLNDILVLTRV